MIMNLLTVNTGSEDQMDKYDQELAKFFGIDELIEKEVIKTEPNFTVKDFEVIDGVRIIKKIDLNSVSINNKIYNDISKENFK